MGCDLAEAYPLAQQLLAEADRIVGFPLSQICFHGPAETLTETNYAQPAILAISLVCLRILEERLPERKPAMTAGHSLGEYAALVAAGSLSFEDALLLVRERGRLMAEVGKKAPGGMAAMLGLSEEKLVEICEEVNAAGGVVQVANVNAPGQVVISGSKDGLQRATDLALQAGASRVIPLAVSAAPHSPLMEAMAEPFRQAIAKVRIKPPQIPIIGNITARPLAGVDEIKKEMELQLTSPVRWVESIQYMVSQGINAFVEVGPGEVLKGLVRRIDRQAQVISAGDVQGIEALVEQLKEVRR